MLPRLFASFWMPESASTVSDEVDAIYFFILYLCAFFFVGIVAATVYFALKYKRRGNDDKTSPVDHNSRLEFWWSVLPSIPLVVMFVWGFQHWLTIQIPPANTLDLRVTARQWSWQFDYPREGIVNDQLVVPVNTPVKLVMTSTDVLHAFFVPEFRVKQDVVPGRYSVVWFEATKVGTFNVFCAEYCGKDHSRMITRVVVKSAEDYAAWVEKGGIEGNPDPVTLGGIFVKRYGCTQCHSDDGSGNTGPTLKGLYGKQEKFTDGTSGVVDDNYIVESILNPGAKVVEGFAPRMPSFKGKIKDKHVTAIIEFIKSLK